MKTTTKPYLLLCIALGNESVAASTVSLKAARINDTLTEPSSAVLILPGDVIEWDAYASNWQTDLGLLDTYQLTIDSTSLISGDSGALRPYFYDGPLPLFNLCSTGCIAGAHCGTLLCLPPPCPQGGCPPGLICKTDNWCIQYKDYPLNGSRSVGVLIDIAREDFVFLDQLPLALVDIGPAPGYRWGAIPLAVRGVPDPGVPRYAGTVILKASTAESEDGEASGCFRITLLNHIDLTFFLNPPPGPDLDPDQIVPEIIPLTVNVGTSGAPPPSECNRDGLVTLAEHRHLTECFDGTALEGTCFCLDNNDDGQVDMRDFADLQNLFDGPQVRPPSGREE